MNGIFKTILTCIGMASILTVTGCGTQKQSGKKTYTYRLTESAPQTWSPTDYQMHFEGMVGGWTSDGLYDLRLNESRDGTKFVCSMAAEFPVDVTAEYASDGRYHIPSGAAQGYAWKFSLKKDLQWDDGEPINSSTFEYSLQQFLNPLMKNYRAANYFEGNVPIANAEAYYNGTVSWEEVGFIRHNDYSFTLVLDKAFTPYMITYLVSIPLLRKDIYEANKKESGGLIKSSYGTDVETSASYGPYKITEYQQDKFIRLTKNEKWRGWKDKENMNTYQTTDIYIQFIVEHATNMNLFLQGKLDEIGLDSLDLQKYGNSEYRKITPKTYTIKLSFNIDPQALKNEETEGVNHSILSYIDFRHAISLALDRQKYVDTVAIGSDPGFGLFNNMYFCNPESDVRYRDCEPARKSLCDIYGASDYDDMTGYNKELAKSYFQSAYTQAVRNGDLKPSDKIQIDMHMTTDNAGLKRSLAFIQDAVNDATEGTDLEGKVTFNFVIDSNYYNNMRQGKVDSAITLWGGAPYNPYIMLECYCSSDVQNEYGVHPETETCVIELNGRQIRRTYYEWYSELCNGMYSDASDEIRVAILAGVEKALLERYNMIPIYYWNTNALTSHRIVEGTEHYIDPNIEYGGIQYLTYTMDDDEWEAYCKKNNYQLSY